MADRVALDEKVAAFAEHWSPRIVAELNDRLVARGEIVLVENRLGVTMTEIIKPQ